MHFAGASCSLLTSTLDASIKIKKLSILIISILCIITGALMFIAAPYFSDAKFIIRNKTNSNVSLVARWRNNEKSLGIVKPGASIELSVNDEAAIEFIVTLNENNIIQSQPLYFTSGMIQYIDIHPDEIRVNHGNAPDNGKTF